MSKITSKKAQSSYCKILFVCNGNVYRSFSAESLLKQYLYEHKIKGWKVFSAGTTAKKQEIDPEVIFKLKTFGIKNLYHRQHKLNKSMLKKFDIVIAMAEDQIDFMKNNFNYKHAVLFNKIASNKRSSIWDIDKVKNRDLNKNTVKKNIDSTIQHIYDSVQGLVSGIEKNYLSGE